MKMNFKPSSEGISDLLFVIVVLIGLAMCVITIDEAINRQYGRTEITTTVTAKEASKSIGVHKCSGAGGSTIFGMFVLETGIILLVSLVCMALLLLGRYLKVAAITKVSDGERVMCQTMCWIP